VVVGGCLGCRVGSACWPAERAVCRVRRVDGHGEDSRESVEFGPEAAVSAVGVVSGQGPPGEVPGSSPAFSSARALGGLDRPGSEAGFAGGDADQT